MAKTAMAKVTDNQTAMVLGAGIVLAVGAVWYIDYRARTVVKAVAGAAGEVLDSTNNAARVANGFTPAGIMSGIAGEVMGFWGKVLGIGKTEPAADQGVL